MQTVIKKLWSLKFPSQIILLMGYFDEVSFSTIKINYAKTNPKSNKLSKKSFGSLESWYYERGHH